MNGHGYTKCSITFELPPKNVCAREIYLLCLRYKRPVNAPYKIKEDEERREFIFDELRKLWVRLTSEEWVRQNFAQYLVQVMHYPASYVAIEREIKLGERKKRFDMLVFNKSAKAWMMIECKKMDKPLDKTVIWQILHYNI